MNTSRKACLERESARRLESRGRYDEAAVRLRRAMALGWTREEGEETLARLSRASSAIWPGTFSALLCRGRYREAFRLGEESLRASSRRANANAFLWPWWAKVSSRRSAAKARFCARELSRVRRAATGGDYPGWFAFCRGVLLLGLGREAEAMAEYRVVRRLRSSRYALMHHPFVLHRLLAGHFRWTIKHGRKLLAQAPDDWWVQCRLAEALMADGDVPGGLLEFERAAAAAEAPARGAILAWHGAALLWTGRYREALARFDESAAAGAATWLDCWRGAALLKLGHRRQALAALDAAIKADGQDLEARLWRGEAHRLDGRHAEALRDLDRALSLDPRYLWAYVNRALVRGALGDEKRLTADFAKVPSDVLAAVRGPKDKRALLEAALARARGLRRPERYLDAIWMRPRHE